VESVAWIAERKDVLNGFFTMLTLLAYVRYVEKSKVQGPRSKVFYGLTLLFLTLGLMAKAMLVTIPFLLLLLDIWPLGRVASAKWRMTALGIPAPKLSALNPFLIEKWPFFALSALFCAITFLVQQHSPAMASLAQLGPEVRLENVTLSYLRYLGKTVWPVGLAAHYPLPFNDRAYLAFWPDWQIVAGALLLACVSALCLCQLTRRPWLAVGWFWYLVTMLPVIGLVQVGGQGMADHYTYIPLIGPVISLVWLIPEKWFGAGFARGLLATGAIMALTTSVLLTRHQIQYWKNTVSLFQHTVEVTGENAMAEYILGLGLEHEGRISQAMIHYRIATSSSPTVKDAYYCLGRLLRQQEQWTEAEHTYSALLTMLPDDLTGHLGLADTLLHLGRKTEAIEHLDKALQQDPQDPEALNNLAWLLAANQEAPLRDGMHAVALAERACELTHYQVTVMVGTLAAAYAEAGRYDDAVATAQKACALATTSGNQELLQRNQELLALYRNHRPSHSIDEQTVPATNGTILQFK
jgi:cytochrome c-type biogenesis protein CcmH/NrfG